MFIFLMKKTKIYIDEAGRGPLAWPLYVGLVVPLVPRKAARKKIFKDSKKLSESQRETAFQEIKILSGKKHIIYSLWSVTNKEIDKRGVTKSINMAIQRALKDIVSKINAPYILVIDGNTDFKLSHDLGIETQTIIKGDDKVIEISMASIIAKVSRDKVMIKIDKQYSIYQFAKHKWYGTKLHTDLIKKHGPSPVHRKLFLRKLLES